MFRILCMSVCATVTLLCCAVVGQCADFTVKDKQVFFIHEGKEILLTNEVVEPIAHADLRYVTIREDRKVGAVPVPAGTYGYAD